MLALSRSALSVLLLVDSALAVCVFSKLITLAPTCCRILAFRVMLRSVGVLRASYMLTVWPLPLTLTAPVLMLESLLPLLIPHCIFRRALSLDTQCYALRCTYKGPRLWQSADALIWTLLACPVNSKPVAHFSQGWLSSSDEVERRRWTLSWTAFCTVSVLSIRDLNHLHKLAEVLVEMDVWAFKRRFTKGSDSRLRAKLDARTNRALTPNYRCWSVMISKRWDFLTVRFQESAHSAATFRTDGFLGLQDARGPDSRLC